MPVTVTRASPEATYPLRWRVLHPHIWPWQEGSALDHRPDSATWAAVDESTGDVVGSVLVHRLPAPWDPVRRPAWRLRAMAVDGARRREGIADALMAALLDHVASIDSGVVWCSARVPVLAFYRRWGFAPVGEPWVEGLIGPHQLMFRPPGAPSAKMAS